FDENNNQIGTFRGQFNTKDWIDGHRYSNKTKKEQPFSAVVIDGSQIPVANADDVISGKYKRVNQRGRIDTRDAPSELDIWLLKDGQVRLEGYAAWRQGPEIGQLNTGSVQGNFRLQESKVFFKDEDDNKCRFTITFGRNSLTVTKDRFNGCWGFNVTFNGKYRKVGPPGLH